MPNFKKSRGYKMKGHTLPGPNQKASPVKEGFWKKAGGAYMDALKTSAEGFMRGGPLGVLGAQFSAGMEKKKEKEEEKEEEKNDSKQVIDQDALLKASMAGAKKKED